MTQAEERIVGVLRALLDVVVKMDEMGCPSEEYTKAVKAARSELRKWRMKRKSTPPK